MTAFDTDTYPLETATKFKPDLGTEVDQLDDLSYQLRVLTNLKPIEINCVFCPMDEDHSADFETYLYSVAGLELDITHNGKTYRGFIDGKTVDKPVSNGVWHNWSFTFKAEAV